MARQRIGKDELPKEFLNSSSSDEVSFQDNEEGSDDTEVEGLLQLRGCLEDGDGSVIMKSLVKETVKEGEDQNQ